jgi:hypothetical protein
LGHLGNELEKIQKTTHGSKTFGTFGYKSTEEKK